MAYKITDISFEYDQELTLDEWVSAGDEIKGRFLHAQFLLGDWLLAGESRTEWGSFYTEAIEKTGLPRSTLINAKSVAKQYAIHERRPNLPYCHHSVVAFIEDRSVRSRLLDQAEPVESGEQPQMSRSELREKADPYLKKKPRRPPERKQNRRPQPAFAARCTAEELFSEIRQSVMEFSESCSESDLQFLTRNLFILASMLSDKLDSMPAPSESTTARPGSEEKVAVLVSRFESGEGLWSEDDFNLFGSDFVEVAE